MKFCMGNIDGAGSYPLVERRGQGIYNSLSDYYKVLCHHNMLNTKVYQVDITNWFAYCPVKYSIDHVVFIHNVKSHQCGGFYYLVQYLQDMSVFVYQCLCIPAGELKILNSVQMLLDMTVIDGVEHHKVITKDQQNFAKQRHKDIKNELQTLSHYGMSRQQFLCQIIDELILRDSDSVSMHESDPVFNVNSVCHGYYSDEDTVILNSEQYNYQSDCNTTNHVCHINDGSISDVNITGKNRGFLATTVKKLN